MTRIKASCPSCGDVDLAPRQVRLVVCSVPDRSFYAFDCGTCRDEVRKHASSDVVEVLTIAGVPIEARDIPAEALEAHGGPALTWDDLLDLHLALERMTAPASAALYEGHRGADARRG